MPRDATFVPRLSFGSAFLLAVLISHRTSSDLIELEIVSLAICNYLLYSSRRFVQDMGSAGPFAFDKQQLLGPPELAVPESQRHL